MFCEDWTGLENQEVISYCGSKINFVENAAFAASIVIGGAIIYFMQRYMIGILDRRDPMRDVDPPPVEPFLTVSVLCSIVKTVANRGGESSLVRQRTSYALLVLLTSAFWFFFRKQLQYLNKTTNTIVKIGMSWVLYHTFFKLFETFTLEGESSENVA